MLEMLAEVCNRHGGLCRPGIDGTWHRNDSGRQLPNLSGVERHPFLLIFRTPPEVLLLTGIYAMKCGEWGPDLIYIEETMSPDPKDDGHFYQATFN